MANGSQSTRKNKDHENGNSKGRQLNGNSSTTVGSEASDSPGLRRSARESSSNKQRAPSPSNPRKSERLEKRTPTTPPVKRKSVISEKHVPSALRRSERGKKQSPSSSSGSKKSERSSASSDAKKPKEKKEKTVIQLTLETREIKGSEKPDAKPVKKKLDARTYRALFLQNSSKKVDATALKRKRDVDMDSEGKRTEACGTCLKRQRVDSVSTKQDLCSCKLKLDHELSKASIAEDRGGLEDGVTTAVVQICDRDAQPPVDDQTVGDQSICLVCKLGGELLCCDGKGCKQSYHLSCLDPSLEVVPLGVRHCRSCLQKRVKFGVHSISDVESIWDAKELDVSDAGGSQKQKQKHFFVKYKGFAHVHNRLVPESQLLLEAPQLVAKYNQESSVAKWKREWSVPHRLLQKRMLMPSTQHGEDHSESAGGTLDTRFEWLIKWHGLGYEDVTWELENAPFLNSSEGQSLIFDYERRMKAKKDISLARADKREDRKGSALTKLYHLPIGGSPSLDNSNILDVVNKLREFLHKGQNAVIIDDPERVLKVISFLVSLQLDMSQPFLIIASSDALYSWESEFFRLAPSVNVVVYSGNKDLRKSIRSLEFFEECRFLMCEVLVSPIEVVVEDLQVLNRIGWKGIIVDDCEHSRICTYFEQIKMLTTDMRLLLVRGQLKDTAAEYLNLLSLLDSNTDLCNTNGLRISQNDSSSKLKERLSRYIANEDKDISRFVEYWVPVQLSNIQLEQYCATLLSNSICLQSPLRNDPVGALRDTLISTRKCCDHPYILDSSLQQGLPVADILDFGIKASGKLQLLYSMLMEIKNKGLRVLVLYQSIGGSGRDSSSIGDILDDLVRQKFGHDSYERVDGVSASSKSKQTALNKFNDKDCGRFIFLLETRACLASIKLSSVDTVVIYGSDWNPVNDLKALQKITIDSQSKQIKLFRLYSSWTVEEKVLMLEKHDMTRDCNLQSCTTNHKLLMWGASYLFNKLDEFHGCASGPSAGVTTEHSLFSNVLQEFMTILDQSSLSDSANKSILKVKLNGATYCGKFSLLGEREIQFIDEEPPQVFWKNLLEGKQPHWKYVSSKSSSQRNRKRVQYFSESPDKLQVVSEGVTKKCKKMVSDSIDPHTMNTGQQDEVKVVAEGKEGGSRIPVNDVDESLLPTSSTEFEGRRKVRDAQKNLCLLLKPEVFELCETLQLSEDIKGMVEKFLEYVMNNHCVSREPATILQAFQISLCWVAASLLKKKIDHKQSLELARQHLNFCCNEEEAEFVYLKLRCLKHMFLYRTGNLKIANSPRTSSSSPRDEPFGSLKASHHQQEDIVEQSLSIKKLVEGDILVSMKRLKKKCEKQLLKLNRKDREEVNELCRVHEEEKAELERKHKTEMAVIRCLDKSSAGADKLKMLEKAFARKVEQHKQQLDKDLEDLMRKQHSARKTVEHKFTILEDEVKSWSQVELLNRLLSDESGCVLENPQTGDGGRVQDDNENVSMEKRSPDRSGRGLPIDVVASTVGSADQIGSIICPGEKEGLGTVDTSGSLEHHSGAMGPKHLISMNLDRRDPHVTPSTVQDTQASSEMHETVCVNNNPVNAVIMDSPLSETRICNGTMVNLIDGEAPHLLPETAHLNDYPQPPDEQIQDGLTETLSSRDVLDSSSSVNPPTKTLDGIISSSPGDKVQIGSHVTAGSCHNTEKVLSLSPLSSGERTPDAAVLRMSGEELEHRLAEICDELTGVHMNRNIDGMLGDVPLVQSEGTVTQGGPLPLDQLLQDQCSLPLMPSETQDGDAPSSKEGHDVEQAPQSRPNDDAVPSDCSLEAPAVEAVVQSQLPPTDTPLVENPLDLSSAGEIGHPPIIPEQNGASNDVQSDCNHEASVVGSLDRQVLQDQCSPPLISTEIQDGNAPSNKDLCDTQQVEAPQSHPNVDAEPSDCNIEAPTTEPPVQLPLSQTDACSAENPLDLPSADETETQTRTDHDLPSGAEIENQPRNEEQNVAVEVEPPQPQSVNAQPSENRIHEAPIREPVVQLPLSAPMDSSSARNPLPTVGSLGDHPQWRHIQAARVVSRMPLPFSQDPLQNELDRMHKDREHSVKIHEDMKLQLKADCEKEIEEVVAQIRKKYEIKLQESVAEFSSKLKEMDESRNKVLINKILAEAFRCKCMDNKSPAAPGMQQDMVSSSRQPPVQMQQTGQRSPFVPGLSVTSAQIPPAVNPLSSTIPAVSSRPATASQHPPATNPQSSTLPAISSRPTISTQHPLATSPQSSTLPALSSRPTISTQHPSATSPQSSTLPALSSRPTISTQYPPATTPQSSTLPALGSRPTATPQQPLYHSRPLASIPAVAPQISPITHPAVGRQGGSEIRAPAPHLQRSRPSTPLAPANLPTLPNGMPSQPAPNAASSSTPLSSTSLPPLPRRLPNQQAPNAASSPTPLPPTSLPPLPRRMPSQQATNAASSPTPLSPTSLPPLPRRMPSQQATNAASFPTSLSPTSLPPLPQRMSSHQAPMAGPSSSSSVVPPRPPLPAYTSGSFSGPNWTEVSGRPSSAASVPAVDLLMEVDNRAGSGLPNILSPLPDLGSNLDQVDISGLGLNAGNAPAQTPAPNDIVCLSDDD